MGRPAKWMQKLTGRGAMCSPGAPSLRREIERRFWQQIATGITSERATEAVGVSPVVGARWSGRRVNRYGRKLVIGGLMLGLLGLAASIAVVLMHEQFDMNVWWLLLSLSFVGLAQGAVISPNQALTLAEVPLKYAGSSGAIMQAGQRIGTSVGIAMITAAVFTSLAVWSWSIAVVIGFALIALVVLAALGVALKDQRDRVRSAARRPDPKRGRRRPLDGSEGQF